MKLIASGATLRDRDAVRFFEHEAFRSVPRLFLYHRAL